MDALYGSAGIPLEVWEGNDWLLLVTAPAHDLDDVERIQEDFLAAIARRKLHVVRLRDDYYPEQLRAALIAEVVPRELVCFGRICYRG